MFIDRGGAETEGLTCSATPGRNQVCRGQKDKVQAAVEPSRACSCTSVNFQM